MILKSPQNGRLEMIAKAAYLTRWAREMTNSNSKHLQGFFFVFEG